MKKKTAGRKVNRAKRKFLCYFLLAAVTLTATGSVWESPAETVQAAPSMSELQNSINNHQNQLNNINSQINSLQDEQDLVQEKIDDLNAEIINTMTSIGMKEDEIAEKEKRLKDERKAKMDSILDSVGSIVGVGKSAAVEKENTQLKTEIERIKKAFPNAVKNKVEELTKTLVEAKQSAEAERDRALAQSRSSITERNEAVKQLQAQEADIQQRISQAVLTATKKKDNTIRLLQGALEASRKILNVIADILYQASEVFRRAVNAIIHFGTEQHKSIFAPSEAADIKSVMQEYGETTEIQKAVGDWLCGYAEDRQPFDEIKHRHTLKEVGDVAEGAYDWKIEKNRNNGIHL